MSRKNLNGPTITPGMYYEFIKDTTKKEKRLIKRCKI